MQIWWPSLRFLSSIKWIRRMPWRNWMSFWDNTRTMKVFWFRLLGYLVLVWGLNFQLLLRFLEEHWAGLDPWEANQLLTGLRNISQDQLECAGAVSGDAWTDRQAGWATRSRQRQRPGHRWSPAEIYRISLINRFTINFHLSLFSSDV